MLVPVALLELGVQDARPARGLREGRERGQQLVRLVPERLGAQSRGGGGPGPGMSRRSHFVMLMLILKALNLIVIEIDTLQLVLVVELT